MTQQRELQQLWNQIRFEKHKSEGMILKIYALLERYRAIIAGRDLLTDALHQQIRKHQTGIDRAALIIYSWVDPRPQMSEWYQRMDRKYSRPTWFLEKGDRWLWIHIVAPAFVALRSFVWRWEKHKPHGDMAVLKRGYAALERLISEQGLLIALLETAIVPANQHLMNPEKARQDDLLMLRRMRELQLENPPPGGLRLNDIGPNESALTQAEDLQKISSSWDPNTEIPAGYVRVGSFGTLVLESMAEAWQQSDKWKDNQR
jgi:hypothetical protein